jgi:hypothetical protein
LHRLEVVALSLGLTERTFEDILLGVVAVAHAGSGTRAGAAPIVEVAQASDVRNFVTVVTLPLTRIDGNAI